MILKLSGAAGQRSRRNCRPKEVTHCDVATCFMRVVTRTVEMDPTLFSKKHTDNKWRSGKVTRTGALNLNLMFFCENHFCDLVPQHEIRHPRRHWPRLDFEIRSSSTARNIVDRRVLAGGPRNHITSLRSKGNSWKLLG